MKYALEEFRVGRWERIGTGHFGTFDTLKKAREFIRRLESFFPLKEVRIVEVEPPKEGAE